MARSKRGPRFSKAKPKKTARRRRFRRSAGGKSGSVGTILKGAIATGVRTLAGWLPGAPVWQAVADFALKEIGITKGNVDPTPTAFKADDVSIYALGGLFVIRTGNLVVNAPTGVKAGPKSIGGRPWNSSIEDFDQCRVHSIRLTLRPEGQFQNRAGHMFVAFQPALDVMSAQSMAQENAPPKPYFMRNWTCFARGPATRNLTLTWTARPTDGAFVNNYRPILHNVDWVEDIIGQVAVYYEDFSRDANISFKPSEFACGIDLSGSITIRNTRAYDTDTFVQPVDWILDNLNSYGMLISNDAGNCFHVAKEDLKCEKHAGSLSCKVSGKLMSVVVPRPDSNSLKRVLVTVTEEGWTNIDHE